MPEEPEAALALLVSATLSPGAIVPLHPVPVSEWIEGRIGKRFIGTVKGSCFKLGLLPMIGRKLYVRGSVVVIVGEVEGQNVHVNLRLPIFVSAFLIAFTLMVAAGLVLSFFGPSNGAAVQLLLALILVFPSLVVAGFFRREASLAEQALRHVLRVS